MARSLVDRARLEFLEKLEGLKHYIGRGDQGIADLLNCSVRTVSKMRMDPYSVSGKYILLVQAYYKREKERAET